jgi:hypothetical protein
MKILSVDKQEFAEYKELICLVNNFVNDKLITKNNTIGFLIYNMILKNFF